MHGVPTKKNSVIACHQPENKIVCRNIFPYLYGGEIIGTPCSNLTSVTQKQIWQKHLRKSCCLRLRRRVCDFSERDKHFKAGSFATHECNAKSPPEKWTIFRTSLFFFSLFCADGSEAICQPQSEEGQWTNVTVGVAPAGWLDCSSNGH